MPSRTSLGFTALALTALTGQAVQAGVGDRETVTGAWFGLGDRMEERGITLEAAWTMDESTVLRGGVERKNAYRHLLDLGLSLDLESSLGWSGASLFVDFQAQRGDNGSGYVGDIQGFSNIDADGHTEIPEVWLEQNVGPLRAKLGKVDGNSEFAYAEAAGEFLNSSAGFSPTIFLMPTYPDPALSANLFYVSPTGAYLGAGLYDGSALDEVPTGQLWGKSAFESPGHAFFISEGGWRIDDESGNSSRISLGLWHHNGQIPTFSGASLDGTGGFFLVAERSQPLGSGTVCEYLQFGTANSEASEIRRHLGAGVSWTGPFAGRSSDVLGLGVSQVALSNDPDAGFVEGTETVFELLYRAQVLGYFAVKPDLQYVKNPGGTGMDDATVGTLRIELSL